jgi:DNA-binding CsgD family transcriptional regulator
MAKNSTAPTAVNPLGSDRSWARTNGTYIAGRAYIDGADQTAAEMEAKWGADRLRLLVSPELREKFDRQRYLLNQAIWHGELEAVRTETGRMVKAWLALDREAAAAGKQPLDPLVWEVALADGRVAAIVPDGDRAGRVNADGREVVVYTLDEIGATAFGLSRYRRGQGRVSGRDCHRDQSKHRRSAECDLGQQGAAGRSTTGEFFMTGQAMAMRGRPELTAKQQTICDFVVQGRTTKEIADRLAISPRTVEFHRAAILAKLGVRNTVALIHKVLETGHG